MLATSGPDTLVVLDEAVSSAPRDVEQIWHLPAAFAAAQADGTGAAAEAGSVRVHFVRIPLPGTDPLPARVLRGALNPPQGWVVPSARRTLPAPAVVLPARGTRVRMLTLIAPVRGEGRPAVRTSVPPGGGIRVETVVPGRRLAFEAGPDGALRRIG